jgi:ferritin-like protein
MSSTPKFIPRNAPAFRHQGLVAGNPIVTRLESAVGNCFPGLEFDMRNLERRFFPFLTVDFFNDVEIRIVDVDISGVRAAGLSKELTQAYEDIANDMPNSTVRWNVERITGDFGPFKSQTVTTADLNGPSGKEGRTPADPWTAVRLLKEGSRVDIEAARRERDPSGIQIRKLSGKRTKYLDDDGSLAAIFEPGEMTQSLCSPWTHDFRDCACFYWASNHPDVVLPPLPPGERPSGKWNLAVPWERADRGTPEVPSAPATAGDDDSRILNYYEINRRWQDLDFVLEGREQRGAYRPGDFSAAPFKDWPELEANLRYAAGVELAVIQEYISAAFSLNPKVRDRQTRDSVVAASAEIHRVFISEMRHLRVANDVLRALTAKHNPGRSFSPALGVATQVPGMGGKLRPVSFRPLTIDVLDDFIAIEKPSEDVDGLYARILSTVMRDESDDIQQMIRSVMADGLDHFETFSAMREWLGAPGAMPYLLDLALPKKPPPPEHLKLQQTYLELLRILRTAYATNSADDGAQEIAEARMKMVGPGGIEDQCGALVDKGVLVTFDLAKDPDFAAVAPPL